MIVDSHVHVCKDWWAPVESLIFEMDRNGVDKALLTQFFGNFDNTYILDCVRQYSGRFGAVIKVDSQDPDSVNKMDLLAKMGAVGIRIHLDERVFGNDPLVIWRKAAELNLSVSVNGSIVMFGTDDFKKIVEEFPKLKIVLEHLGGSAKTNAHGVPNHALFKNVLSLAKYPNVHIKLPGWGELLPRPIPFRVPPFEGSPASIRIVYDAFGPHRMMWGSDFPTIGHREGYTNALSFPRDRTPFFTAEDKEWIFARTALSVFKI